MNDKFYAGIGSRQTPQEILEDMSLIAIILAKSGFILRSGGADGADTAFEEGCDMANGKKEIFLPWHDFNKNSSPLNSPSPEAYKIAAKFHPVWERLKSSVKPLHARNVHQILGKNLDSPCLFVVCYCTGTGGTMLALRVSLDNKIPVINLVNREKYGTLLSVFSEINNIVGEKKHEISKDIPSAVEQKPGQG